MLTWIANYRWMLPRRLKRISPSAAPAVVPLKVLLDSAKQSGPLLENRKRPWTSLSVSAARFHLDGIGLRPSRIVTRDGRIWNILEGEKSRDLIHNSSLLGRRVRIEGRIYRKAGSVAVSGYQLL